jgi:hypothetical protein
VRSGAEWLDRVQPLWFADVDIRELNMASCGNCVLGQLVNSLGIELPTGHGYNFVVSNGSDRLVSPETRRQIVSKLGIARRLSWQQSIERGFDLNSEDTRGDDGNAWHRLRDLWVDEIRDRLSRYAS